MTPTDWIIAGSSVASLAVAIFATVIAWLVHRHEQHRFEKADQNERRSQANLISVWEERRRLPLDKVPDGLLDNENPNKYGDEFYVSQSVSLLVNRSNLPVYNVVTMPRTIPGIPSNHGLLPPGERELHGATYHFFRFYGVAPLPNLREGMDLSFHDASGRWWVRQAEGQLIEVSSQEEHDKAMRIPTETIVLSGR